MKPRRTQSTIFYDLLKVAISTEKPLNPTKLQLKTGLAYNKLKIHTTSMEELGLIITDPQMMPTQKGIDFFNQFGKVQQQCKIMAFEFGFAVEPEIPTNVQLDYAELIKNCSEILSNIVKEMEK